eukprot:631642-Pelagomonas_calceolata.AAC.9
MCLLASLEGAGTEAVQLISPPNSFTVVFFFSKKSFLMCTPAACAVQLCFPVVALPLTFLMQELRHVLGPSILKSICLHCPEAPDAEAV